MVDSGSEIQEHFGIKYLASQKRFIDTWITDHVRKDEAKEWLNTLFESYHFHGSLPMTADFNDALVKLRKSKMGSERTYAAPQVTQAEKKASGDVWELLLKVIGKKTVKETLPTIPNDAINSGVTPEQWEQHYESLTLAYKHKRLNCQGKCESNLNGVHYVAKYSEQWADWYFGLEKCQGWKESSKNMGNTLK